MVFLKKIFIMIFLLLFLVMTGKLFRISQTELIIIAIVFLVLSILLIIPSMHARSRKEKLKSSESIVVIDREWDEDEFHNDFSRVGSADDSPTIIKDTKCSNCSSD